MSPSVSFCNCKETFEFNIPQVYSEAEDVEGLPHQNVSAVKGNIDRGDIIMLQHISHASNYLHQTKLSPNYAMGKATIVSHSCEESID
jgi:hypothetical protein